MQLLDTTDDSVAQSLGGCDPPVTTTAGFGGIERLTRNCVGELRQRSTVVHLGLGALGLHLVKKPSQLRYLLLVKLELVCQKPERPADTKSTTAALETFTMAVAFTTSSAHKEIAPAMTFGRKAFRSTA
jgi:hypothetical protein